MFFTNSKILYGNFNFRIFLEKRCSQQQGGNIISQNKNRMQISQSVKIVHVSTRHIFTGQCSADVDVGCLFWTNESCHRKLYKPIRE